jgi:hypothetical protein
MTEMIRRITPVDGRLCAERPAARQVETETGTVFMNRCDYLDPVLAWTGVNDTAAERRCSRVGYETLTHPKFYHLRVSF